MNNRVSKFSIITLFLLASQTVSAQSAVGGSSHYVLYVLGAITVLLIFAAVILLSNTFMAVEADKLGVSEEMDKESFLPSFSSLGKSKVAGFAAGKNVKVLKKGHDILLEGDADKVIDESVKATTFAVQPQNFMGISPIPKVTVVVGDEVKAGEILFFDKKKPDVKYVAPVSGEVIAVNRGAKRAISEVVILADKDQKYGQYPSFDLGNASRKDLVAYLMEGGAWAHINQRPFDMIPEAEDIPKAIFISTFDTAPLAPDMNLMVKGKEAAFQKGLDVLAKLTPGKVHLGVNASGDAPSAAFTDAKGVEVNYFQGPHPAGNVGVHIHHTDPINSVNEKVWTLGVQDVITVGGIFLNGRYDAERVVALTGAEFEQPKYVRTYLGAKIGDLVKGNLQNEKARLIAGDVLTGKKKTVEQFLDFSTDQITTVEEGDQYEMFGWLAPLTPRPSISKTFLSNSISGLKYKANTNTHGEKRAFVITGQYESVLPMDIYAQQLMKSILVNDFERMEGLGIYELSEEDVALCEFVCTSKQPLQKILREGLNTMREQ